MTPELAAFSDWTLALLARLFLYPGGLWLLVMLLAMRFGAGGRQAISLKALAADLSSANLLSIAVAWTALALSPLPGDGTLPSPVDGLVLAALPVLSLTLDLDAFSSTRLLAAGAITVALIVPAIESGTLLVRASDSILFLALSSLAILFGLLALSMEGNRGVAGEVRWLVWLCLGVVPLWQHLTGDSPWAASLFVLAGVVVLNMMRNVEFGMRKNNQSAIRNPQSAIAIAWLLPLGALLWALLAVA